MAEIIGTQASDILQGTAVDDWIRGLGGADDIKAGEGSDSVEGGDGGDHLDGGLGDDILSGGADDDVLTDNSGLNAFEGGAGNDHILSNSSVPGQTLRGGDGVDSLLLYNSADSSINGGTGDDFIGIYNAVNATANGGIGDDTILYTNYSGFVNRGTAISGGSGNDSITAVGYDSGLTLDGGLGDDLFTTVDYYDSILVVSGGGGSDTYTLNPVASIRITDFAAGANGDKINVASILQSLSSYAGGNPFATGHLALLQQGADTLLQLNYLGAGGDMPSATIATLTKVTVTQLTKENFGGYDLGGAAPASQIINGTASADILRGTLGDDVIHGFEGLDQIVGGDGSDTLDGGVGGDDLSGGLGNDVLLGGADDDVLSDSAGLNVFEGGAGNDLITSMSSVSGQILIGGDGIDSLRLYSASDSRIDGGDGNDFIAVNGARDTIVHGGSGDDTIEYSDDSGSSNLEDVIFGDGGNDSITVIGLDEGIRLDGGSGNDTFDTTRHFGSNISISGGSGRDTYTLNSAPSTLSPGAILTISDFAVGADGDRIDVASLLQSLPSYADSDVFSTEHLALVQQGSDTLLQVDYDGRETADYFKTVAILKGITSANLTSQNLIGYDPAGFLDHLPSNLTLLSASVAENSLFGAVVGSLTGADEDGDDLTYSLLDDAEGRFAVDAKTGRLTIADGSQLDYETALSHQITARVTDEKGGYLDQSFTISLLDLAETRSITLTSASNIYTAPTDDNWVISGLGGDDSITGRGGSDIINGGSGNDILSGAGGDDTFTFEGLDQGFDTLVGGTGFDTLKALGNNSIVGLNALREVETITADGFKNVSVMGSGSADYLDFNNVTLVGIYKIDGGAGNDTIKGSADADVINGGAGNDTLLGGGAIDTIFGGNGNDIIQYDATGDIVGGGHGSDTLVVKAKNVAIDWESITSIETVRATGYAGVSIIGTAGADTLDFSAVTLRGIANVSGGAGDDTIVGSAGADNIWGGAGKDVLTGGPGSDIFSFAAKTESGSGSKFDRITDFVQGSDHIDLSATDANFTALGNGTFAFIDGSAFTKARGELRVDASHVGYTSVLGDTDGNGLADFEIRLDWQSSSLPINLHASDFIL